MQPWRQPPGRTQAARQQTGGGGPQWPASQQNKQKQTNPKASDTTADSNANQRILHYDESMKMPQKSPMDGHLKEMDGTMSPSTV